jgi:hypothetical protein
MNSSFVVDNWFFYCFADWLRGPGRFSDQLQDLFWIGMATPKVHRGADDDKVIIGQTTTLCQRQTDWSKVCETGAEHEVSSNSAMRMEKEKAKSTLIPVPSIPEETATIHEMTRDSIMYDDKNLDGSRTASGSSNHRHHHRRSRGGQSMRSNKLRQGKRGKGIIQSLINAILPCISTSKAFDWNDSTDPPVKTTKAPKSKSSNRISRPESSSAVSTKAGNQKMEEKPVSLDNGDLLPPSPQPINTEPIDTSLTEIGLIPILPPQLTAPPTPSETTIIVPPTPVTHLLPDDETWGMTSGAVQPPGSTGEETWQTNLISSSTDVESEIDDSADDTDPSPSARTSFSATPIHLEEDEEAKLIRQGGSGIPIGLVSLDLCLLLPELLPSHRGRKCLVLDMDETLLHGSFKVTYTFSYSTSPVSHFGPRIS